MKRILVFVMILCLVLLLCVNAQDKWVSPPAMNDKIGYEDPETYKEVPVPEPKPVPVAKPVTNLTVKLIDEMNNKVVELNNCIVYIDGELHICENSFRYSKTFVEGDKYEMVIWMKLKK